MNVSQRSGVERRPAHPARPCDSRKLLAEREPLLADERDGGLASCRIVTSACSVLELGHGHFDRQRGPVGPVADHRLDDVGDCQDACLCRISPSRRPAGYPEPSRRSCADGSSPPRFARSRSSRRRLRRRRRVGDELHLGLAEPSRLGEDLGRQDDLADVVQESADAQRHAARLVPAELEAIAQASSATRRWWPAV